MRIWFLRVASLALMVGCSGKAVVDPGTTTSSSTGSGTTTSCDDLEAAYAAAFQKARVCDPAADTPQCTEQVDTKLLCPCLSNYVNPAGVAELKQLSDQWQAAGCGNDVDCPAIGCVQPTAGKCDAQPPGSSAPGLCESI